MHVLQSVPMQRGSSITCGSDEHDHWHEDEWAQLLVLCCNGDGDMVNRAKAASRKLRLLAFGKARGAILEGEMQG